MIRQVGDLVHEVLLHQPHYVLIPEALVTTYKRELVPETLPAEALDLVTNVRVHRRGHTAIVASSLTLDSGTVLTSQEICGLRMKQLDRVTGYHL